MINKLISKSEVRLLEWDGIQSNDYVDGFCDAIQKVIDLEPIPTLGVDEVEKIRAEIDEQYDRVRPYNIDVAQGLEMALEILNKYDPESEDKNDKT